MDLKLVNHSSYPRIGDTPEGQLLRRTIAQWEKGEKTEAELAAAADRMTEWALQDQIGAGLDVVTDGLIRWYDPASHLAGKLSGVRINGLLRFFDTNCYFRQPIVQGKIERTRPLVVEEFQFAQKKSSRPVKPVLTGPYTLARLSIEENATPSSMEKLLAGFTEALAKEVAALAAAGATQIHVDEPSLLKHPEDFPAFERSIAALAAGKQKAQLLLAFYFGDPAPLYPKLQKLPVDGLILDFTYSPKLVEVIAAGGSSKTLGLGVVDGRNTRLEDPSAAAKQLEKILAAKPAGAFLTSSCGLEYLPRDRAQLKLNHLATIKKTLLGKAA